MRNVGRTRKSRWVRGPSNFTDVYRRGRRRARAIDVNLLHRNWYALDGLKIRVRRRVQTLGRLRDNLHETVGGRVKIQIGRRTACRFDVQHVRRVSVKTLLSSRRNGRPPIGSEESVANQIGLRHGIGDERRQADDRKRTVGLAPLRAVVSLKQRCRADDEPAARIAVVQIRN